MNNQEAVNVMEKYTDTSISRVVSRAHILAIAALEKQVPKKPAYEGDGCDKDGNIILDTWICPCCSHKYEVDYDDYQYCPECGQKMDWEEKS